MSSCVPPPSLQNEIVARLHRLHRADVVGGQRIGPARYHIALEKKLPHVREIEEPGAMPNRVVLGQDARILHRHVEAGERHHARAETRVLVVERGALIQ